MTAVLRTREELNEWLATHSGSRGVVLTMGALHAGHAALMQAARADVGSTGFVIVTIFVNPAQFGPAEDFEKYPRTLEDDIALCETNGVDVVFAPSVDEVYPSGSHPVHHDAGPVALELEGAARPGHFDGVLMVVALLLLLTQADVTFFGEKDYQQLALVRRLPDLEPRLAGCRFVGVPTVRDADGLAMSSRNRYLDASQRVQALAIPACVSLVQRLCADGARGDEAERAGRDLLSRADGIELDYVVVRAPDLGACPRHGEARVLVAARVGSTRLLDNGPVTIRGERA